MKRLSFLSAIAFAVFFIASCKSGSTGLPIPKDAAIIVHIDAKSLSSKLSWDEIKATEWFKEAYKKSQEEKDSLMQMIMDDPENSGVDVKSDFAFFMQSYGSGNYVVFEGNLKNADKFESIVKEKNKNEKILESGDLKYLKFDRSSLLTWNKSKFFVLGHERSSRSYSSYDDEKPAADSDSLLIYAKSLTSLKKDESIESNDHFTSLIKEAGDVHFWLNMEKYYALMGPAMQQGPMGAMMSTMNRFYKDNYSTGVMSFEDGRIAVKTKQYHGEEMKKVLDKYKFQPITKEMVNRIPSQNVVGALLVNYPPEAMKEILKAMGMDGFANMFLGKINYSLDELIQATKGQIILTATDFTWPANTNPNPNEYSPMGKPDIKILLGLSVNNKSSFDKLVNVLESQIKDSTERQMLLSKVSYQANNEWFAISNNPQAVQQFLAGNTNNNLPFADKITGHSFGLYIDIQKILKSVPPQLLGQSGMMDVSINTWQDVVATGGDYKDGVSTGEFSINLIDKKTNALKQMNQYIEKMYLAQKKAEQDMRERFKNYQTDSVEVVPDAPKE